MISVVSLCEDAIHSETWPLPDATINPTVCLSPNLPAKLYSSQCLPKGDDDGNSGDGGEGEGDSGVGDKW